MASKPGPRTIARWTERLDGIKADGLLSLLVESGLVALGLGLATRFGWMNGGQIEGTDVLLYMDAAQHGDAHIYILNRYVHVYLHTLFNALAPNPLVGARLLSAFLTGGCVLLVYLCARNLTPRSTPLNGAIAVGAFLSVPLTVHLLMAPQVDSTLMLMSLLIVVLYIWSARNGHARAAPILALGAAIFFGLKTKETALAMVVLVPGLGMGVEGLRATRALMRRVRYLAAGFLAGGVAFLLLNGIILGDPLFGFRPSEFFALGRIASSVFVLHPGGGDWISGAVLASASTVFILYVAAGLRGRSPMENGVWLVWLVPLSILCLMTFTLVKSTWGVSPRYFAPGIGVMCALAGHVVDGRMGRSFARDHRLVAALLAGAVVGGTVLVGLSLRSQWPFPDYFASILAPVTLAGLLGMLFVSQQDSRSVQLTATLFALMLTLYPARQNLLDVARTPAEYRPNIRFHTFEAFQAVLPDRELGKLFITPSIADLLKIGMDRNELFMLTNVYFGSDSRLEDVAIGQPNQALRLSMADAQYDHVILSRDDWDTVRTADEDVPGWRDRYEVLQDFAWGLYMLDLRK
jgi:4-amino-4-deoxy-L-arabinose transferase-like glycosyltransferase